MCWVLLLVLSGVNPVANIPSDTDDPPKDARKELHGTWSYLMLNGDGKELREAQLEGFECIYRGDEFTFRVGEFTTMHGKYTLSPAKNPKAIDFIPTDRAHKGKTFLGIYRREGDELQVCYAAPGHERPTDFTAKAGSHRTLIVLKKKDT
jgi:uncharacterized protein (TIGR03067 family)